MAENIWQYAGNAADKQLVDTLYTLEYASPYLTLHGSDGSASTVEINAEVVNYRLEMPSLGVVQLKGSDGSVSEIRLPCSGGGDNLPVDAAFMAIFNDGDGLVGTVADAEYEVVT